MALLITVGAPPKKKYSEKHFMDQAEKGGLEVLYVNLFAGFIEPGQKVGRRDKRIFLGESPASRSPPMQMEKHLFHSIYAVRQ